MTKNETTKTPTTEDDDPKPDRSFPDAVVVSLDDLATQDDADLTLILGLNDPDAEPDDDESA